MIFSIQRKLMLLDRGCDWWGFWTLLAGDCEFLSDKICLSPTVVFILSCPGVGLFLFLSSKRKNWLLFKGDFGLCCGGGARRGGVRIWTIKVFEVSKNTDKS